MYFKLLLISALFSFSAFADLYDISVKDLKGKPVSLSKYKGKVLLIVNTASKCGYTPQFGELEKLNKMYKDKNFAVLGFPSNDFKQEDLEGGEIAKFCRLSYGVTFDMFAKSSVNGENRNPVYKYLLKDSSDIKWNFEKLLVSKEGKMIKRFPSKVSPLDKELTSAIEAAI